MTKGRDAQEIIADFASQMARSPDTLAALEEVMAKAKRDTERGKRLHEIRELRNLTQRQVADRVGVEKRTYQNWEAGGGTSSDNWEALAEVLGVSYAYLVSGEGEGPLRFDIAMRLSAIESKLDAVIAHLGIEIPAEDAGEPLSEPEVAPELGANVEQADPEPQAADA